MHHAEKLAHIEPRENPAEGIVTRNSILQNEEPAKPADSAVAESFHVDTPVGSTGRRG